MSTATAVGVRVLLVDDEPSVLEALSRVLTAAKGALVVGALSSAGALVQTVASLRPDVVLLDLDMPGRGALEVVRDLRDAGHAARVVVLSGSMQEQQVRAALATGVLGYILKDDAPAALWECLPRTAAGIRYLSPSVASAYPGLA